MKSIKLFAILSGLQMLKYILLSGSAYLFFWKWRRKWALQNGLQKKEFKKAELMREFLYSLSTSVIYGLILTLIFQERITSDFKFKPLPFQTTWLYDLGCFFIIILFHDTYSYWMHRLMHYGVVFKFVHRAHHLSRNPSPWAALSFHPIEAVIQAIWVWPIATFLSIQPAVWILFSLIVSFINLSGHLGIEIYPKSWLVGRKTRWLNYPTMHNRHHQFMIGNYGTYFSLWDRWMGTFQ